MVCQVLQSDPRAHELLSELLLPHLARLVEADHGVLPPLKLELCAQMHVSGVLKGLHDSVNASCCPHNMQALYLHSLVDSHIGLCCMHADDMFSASASFFYCYPIMPQTRLIIA